ncbi:MAG TPA: VacJ family lipoprotein [Rhodanobacteraceae bacterium]
MPRTRRLPLARCFAVAILAGTLAACAVAPPRTDDPLQPFNRKMFKFNQVADKVAIRPVAKAYTHVTTPGMRTHISDFFANARTPITIINEVLQGRPEPALQSTGRFAVNTTLGLLGFFDPASQMDLPAHPTDFGVTLAHWGVPEGPYLVLPFIGPTTLRDVWRLPVDSYFDPLAWYAREHDLKWHAEYAPEVLYLVTVRANLLPLDKVLDSAYDPYAFMRDAYRQHRLSQIYYGNPPLSAIEELQGTTPSQDSNNDLDQLLEQQQQYEQQHHLNGDGEPAAASTSGMPAAASSGAAPAAASSVAAPASARTTVAPPSSSVPPPGSGD